MRAIGWGMVAFCLVTFHPVALVALAIAGAGWWIAKAVEGKR